jgi:Na+-translocating ferredoxin:NAD+ oxidoreductase RnfG subunit
VARRLPGVVSERQTVFLTAEQREQIGKVSGAAFKDEIVYPYVLRRDGAVVATAYLDVHRVRTLPEKVVVLVATDGKLLGIEVLAFSEPPDYLAPARWYDRLAGRAMDDTLRLGKGVDGVAGATLTCRAAVDCARRILSLHAVLNPR